MHNLQNCRFIFDDNADPLDKLKLELVLLASKDITWVSSKTKRTLADLKINSNSKYFWVKDSKIYKSDRDYEPFSYLPLLNYKEIIEKY